MNKYTGKERYSAGEPDLKMLNEIKLKGLIRQQTFTLLNWVKKLIRGIRRD